jgi:hypothetical protein
MNFIAFQIAFQAKLAIATHPASRMMGRSASSHRASRPAGRSADDMIEAEAALSAGRPTASWPTASTRRRRAPVSHRPREWRHLAPRIPDSRRRAGSHWSAALGQYRTSERIRNASLKRSVKFTLACAHRECFPRAFWRPDLAIPDSAHRADFLRGSAETALLPAKSMPSDALITTGTRPDSNPRENALRVGVFPSRDDATAQAMVEQASCKRED